MLENLKPFELEEEVEIDDGGEALKAELLEKFHGALDDVHIHKALVLVGIFERERMGKNSKVLTAISSQKEDIYQGRVGLVLKTGPLAFLDTKDVQFGGMKVAAGDWCFFLPENSRRIQINGIECRLIEDVHIDGDVSDPYVLM